MKSVATILLFLFGIYFLLPDRREDGFLDVLGEFESIEVPVSR